MQMMLDVKYLWVNSIESLNISEQVDCSIVECTNFDVWCSIIICWQRSMILQYNPLFDINKFKEWAFTFYIWYQKEESTDAKLLHCQIDMHSYGSKFRIEFIMHKQHFIDKTEYFPSTYWFGWANWYVIRILNIDYGMV